MLYKWDPWSVSCSYWLITHEPREVNIKSYGRTANSFIGLVMSSCIISAPVHNHIPVTDSRSCYTSLNLYERRCVSETHLYHLQLCPHLPLQNYTVHNLNRSSLETQIQNFIPFFSILHFDRGLKWLCFSFFPPTEGVLSSLTICLTHSLPLELVQ